jgi:hypothetical protein
VHLKGNLLACCGICNDCNQVVVFTVSGRISNLAVLIERSLFACSGSRELL